MGSDALTSVRQALADAQATIARLEAERDEALRDRETYRVEADRLAGDYERLEAERDEAGREVANLAQMLGRIQRERDLAGASASRMRELVDKRWKEPNGHCGHCGYRWDDHAYFCIVGKLTADPAPTAWLAARIEEAVEPYRAMLGKVLSEDADRGIRPSTFNEAWALAGRAGTEGQP